MAIIEGKIGDIIQKLKELGLPDDYEVTVRFVSESDRVAQRLALDEVAARCAAYAEKSGMREEDMSEILGLTDKEFENIFDRTPRKQSVC